MSKGALVVRVWEDGSRRPVGGASVHLYGAKGLISVGTTDDAGSAEFRDLDDGWVGARASAAGFANSDPQWQTIGADATVAMHFAMQAGVAVEGRVVAKDGGAPVAGARVEALRGWQIGHAMEAFTELTTDVDGRFRIVAVPRVSQSIDATVLVFTHPQFATTDVVVRPSPTDPGPIHVRAEMPAGATLRGLVRDTKGEPVAEALAVAHRGRHSVQMLPWSRGSSWSGGPGGNDSMTRPHSTESAADGSFALEGLVRGEEYTVCASAEGRTPSAPEIVRAEGDAAALDLRLRDTWRLNVRVVDVDGSPVADATLSVFGPDESCSPESTGPGAWRIDDIGLLQARVFVQAVGYVHDYRHVERPTRRARSILVVLKRARHIAGVVVDDLGAPVAGARVWAEDSNLSTDDAGLDRAGEADADGRFRIEDRSSKRHRVFAQSVLGDRGAIRRVRPPADDVRIVVPRGVVVRVRVAPPASEVLYAHAAKPARRRSRGAPSDWRHGTALAVRDDFAVTGVPVGGAVLRLLVPGYQRVEREVVASRGEIVDLGTIDLEPSIELCGRVMDSGGRPLAGTVVSVEQPLRGDETAPWNIHATTDDDGAFRLRGLWRGDVRVLVHASRFPPPGFDVQVDGATPVTLTLPARSGNDSIADELSRLR